MNATQRGFAVATGIAIAASCLHVPFTYVGEELPSQAVATGTAYRPIFSPPAIHGIQFDNVGEGANAELRDVFVERASLDSGKVGLIWGAIALAGLVLMVVAGAVTDPSQRQCPACAEMIKREAVKCRYCGTPIAPAPSAPESAAT